MIRLFYHDDAAAAVARGKELRTGKKSVSVTHTLACSEADAVDGLLFMPDVPEFERQRLTKLFGVPAKDVPVIIPPAPPFIPAPPDALSSLPENWRDMPTSDMKAIAASIDSRAVENREQAVAVIEAALAARS